MQITVKYTTKENSTILKEAAEFFSRILLNDISDEIVLDIEVNCKDVDGECIDECGNNNPRFFTIRLKKQDISNMISILGHEMVHLKQYATNELKDHIIIMTDDGIKFVGKWKNEIWEPKELDDPYFDSPWEIEAHGLQASLHYKWDTRYDPEKKWCINDKMV